MRGEEGWWIGSRDGLDAGAGNLEMGLELDPQIDQAEAVASMNSARWREVSDRGYVGLDFSCISLDFSYMSLDSSLREIRRTT